MGERANHDAMDSRTGQSLMAALEGLAAQTADQALPHDLEARILARAEAANLFVRAATENSVACGANGVRVGASLLRFPGWAWATAAAALAFVLWTAAGLWRESGESAPSPSHPAVVASVPNSLAREVAAAPQGPLHPASPPVETAPTTLSTAPDPPRRRAGQPKPGYLEQATVAAAGRAGNGALERAAGEQSVEEEGSLPVEKELAYTGFVPVAIEPALLPNEFAQTVRVRVEPEDLWRLGLPVAPVRRETQQSVPERIYADFLVGEDGRPRAVRLVSATRD